MTEEKAGSDLIISKARTRAAAKECSVASEFYEALEACEFAAATGATFSINSDPAEAPASHNVCMLLRHHQVMHELEATRLTAIPNLYWRDYRDRRRWAEWLSEQMDVSLISRDFSRTKAATMPFLRELAGFIEIIRQSGRCFHVFLVGVGSRKAEIALRHLDRVGCTASVVTAFPVMEALICGRELRPRGAQRPEEFKNDAASRTEMALRNLEVMEQFLIEVVSPLASYRDYHPLYNKLGSPIRRKGDRPTRKRANSGDPGG